MSSPKPAKSSGSSGSSDSYTVKYSNKTGGAYAEMRDVIESERKNWDKSNTAEETACGNANSNKPKK
jgi:hypothetical protein